MSPKESYAEDWSMHPGAALRKKRGLTAKEQQALALHPAILDQAIFESPELRGKAFYTDSKSLIFCGEVREVLGWGCARRSFRRSTVTTLYVLVDSRNPAGSSSAGYSRIEFRR